MTWGVYDINAVVIPFDRGILSQNGDTPFFFLIIGVHQALGADIFAVESPGLAQEFINQSSFTVVNVGDDRNITQVFNGHDGT